MVFLKALKKMALKNRALYACVCLLGLIYCSKGRTAKRSDVYIAGFFPYGDGVENSDTGNGNSKHLRNYSKYIVSYSFE